MQRFSIGLTGSIGAGKSTVLEGLRAQGCEIVQTDVLAHALLEHDATVREAVRDAFGGGVFSGEAGRETIDRAALGRLVFDDPLALQRLEAIVHPRVRAAWLGRLEHASGVIAVEIPLLFEKDLAAHFHMTLCVSATAATRHPRLRKRGMSAADIARREARQWPDTRKAEAADAVLINEGSRAHLEAQLQYVWATRVGSEAPST